jgi:peptide/nickel transport system ATP-binding protein
MIPLISAKDIEITFGSKNNSKTVIQGISFEIFDNEILGVVGESGSGKSVSSLALMGLLPKGISKISNGSLEFQGENLIGLSQKDWRKIRGSEIAMIFQEPMSSLNPSMKCGKQVEEMLLIHSTLNKQKRYDKVISLLEKVRLPQPEVLYNRYPHEISGGQKQRVMIAMALACEPKLLIADEPTTALDVTVQKEIVQLLQSIQKETGMSVLFISHDLSLISEISHRVLVMYQGKIVEQGRVEEVFTNPQNEYTKALIASRPPLDVRLKRLPTIQDFIQKNAVVDIDEIEDRRLRHQKMYAESPLLEVINVSKEYINYVGLLGKKQTFKAVDSVSFSIYDGETLGLVGESGCGKSTLGNAILQLDKISSGQILYKGQDITMLSKSQIRVLRKEIQIIFQDPFSSLHPRITIGQAIMEPMMVHKIYETKAICKQKTIELLNQVGLSEEFFDRFPHEFSGGQRQRIGIARTIAVQPKLIVCDESVSALDISVQAQVLNLLNDLKENYGFTYLFISHDLAVVKYMCDQIIVMNKGQIEEQNEADTLYSSPEKEYTKRLIDAIPKGIKSN